MLKELRITDFGLFRSATLPLRKQGLVWISGDNRDTSAATSNGSGKTTLSKALTWCLYGESIDGADGDEVIRHGATRAVVEVDLEDGWTIRRERAKGSPKLQLLKDGKDAKGSKADNQARIIELVGLDFKAFRNTALYGQNDAARFADRRVSDTERKDALQRLLRAEVLKACAKVARSRATARKQEHREALGALEVLRAQLADLDLVTLQDKVDSWESYRTAEIANLHESAMELKQEAILALSAAKRSSTRANEVAALELAMKKAEEAGELADKTEDELETYAAKLQQITNKISSLNSDVKHLKSGIEQMDGDRCPICDNSLVEGHAVEHRAGLEGKLAVAERELIVQDAARKESFKARGAIRTKIEELRAEARKAIKLRSDIGLIKGEMEEAATAHHEAAALVARARDKTEAIKKKRAEINPHVAYLEDAKVKRRALVLHIKTKKTEAQTKGESAAVAEFWVRGFSGQGLPSFLLDSVMPYISERANHYLDILSDGDITLSFATQRELKSSKGEYRDEIAISWVIEEVPDKVPSGGQQRKIEIATDLALMDLAETREGARLSFFWADEVFDGLDSEGVNRVLTLLHELRARRSTVFVVSHSSAMSEIFEKSITVIKERGESRLEMCA